MGALRGSNRATRGAEGQRKCNARQRPRAVTLRVFGGEARTSDLRGASGASQVSFCTRASPDQAPRRALPGLPWATSAL